MGILPKNEQKQPDHTPKKFFVWGYTMHGKSFFANEFPNPLFLSTDGNGDKIAAPSINLRNIRGKDGRLVQNVIDQTSEVITALSSENHSFETLVIDVIDDWFVMLDEAVCDVLGVEYLGDLAHGRGWGLRNVKRNNILTQLQNLPLNVIFISRYSTETDKNGNTKEIPSLKEDLLNLINGTCDYNIQCKRVGKTYLRLAVDRRQAYKREHVKDERIRSILDTVNNAFEKEAPAANVVANGQAATPIGVRTPKK